MQQGLALKQIMNGDLGNQNTIVIRPQSYYVFQSAMTMQRCLSSAGSRNSAGHVARGWLGGVQCGILPRVPKGSMA